MHDGDIRMFEPNRLHRVVIRFEHPGVISGRIKVHITVLQQEDRLLRPRSRFKQSQHRCIFRRIVPILAGKEVHECRTGHCRGLPCVHDAKRHQMLLCELFYPRNNSAPDRLVAEIHSAAGDYRPALPRRASAVARGSGLVLVKRVGVHRRRRQRQ